MLGPQVTWGELRSLHAYLAQDGSSSPDDLLADPVFAQKGEGKADDELVYPENAETEEELGDEEPPAEVLYWFTVDGDDERLLELLMTDEIDGVMYYRTGGEWVEVNVEEYSPTVFEVDMVDIEPNSAQWAMEFWDEQENATENPTLKDVESHLA